MGDAIELFTNSAIRFNGLTLLAYLNYTPRLRYTHEDQIHYSRTRCMARVPSRMPTVQADGAEIGQADSLAEAAVSV